jgi:hypothetical protein
MDNMSTSIFSYLPFAPLTNPIIAIDVGKKLALYGPDGPMEIKLEFERSEEPKMCCGCGIVKPAAEFGKWKRNLDGLKTRCKECVKNKVPETYWDERTTTPAKINIEIVKECRRRGYDVVIENSGPGNSQFPLGMLAESDKEDYGLGLNGLPTRILAISNRGVGARREDEGYPKKKDQQKKDSDALDAKLIYEIATQNPDSWYHWTGPREKIERIHRSVRKLHMDEDDYRNAAADEFIAKLVPFDSLPRWIQRYVGFGNQYNRRMMCPLGQLTTEPFLKPEVLEGRRERMEQLAGLSSVGPRTHYRHMFRMMYMQVARVEFGVDAPNIWSKIKRPIRKKSERIAMKMIRYIFAASMHHQGYPVVNANGLQAA